MTSDMYALVTKRKSYCVHVCVHLCFNQLGETALHLAIQWREKRVMQALLKHNADWSALDKVGLSFYLLA